MKAKIWKSVGALLTTVIVIGAGVGGGLAHKQAVTVQSQGQQQNVTNRYLADQQPEINDKKQVQQDNLNFFLNLSNGTAVLLGFQTKKNTPKLVIPNQLFVNNQIYPVTAIAPGAFANCGLTNVQFNSALQTIGESAFASNYLTSLNLPGGLSSIGANAFVNNAFPHETVVYLGANTKWVKSAQGASFGINYNFDPLVSGIQFVIQNQAVYRFSDTQHSWIISSYMPSVASIKPTGNLQEVVSNKFIRNNSAYVAVNQAKFNNYVQPVNPNNLAIWRYGLAYYALSCFRSNGTAGFLWHFIPSSQSDKFQIQLTSWGKGLLNNGNVTIEIYNPTQNKKVFAVNLTANESYNNQILQMNAAFSGTTFSYGDYVIIQNQSKLQVNIADNYNSNSTYNSQKTIGNLNCYLNLAVSYNSHNGNANYFRVTPDSVNPATPLTIMQNLNCYQNGDQTVQISGCSLPNQAVTVTANIGGQSVILPAVQPVFTNDLGEFTGIYSVSRLLSSGNTITYVPFCLTIAGSAPTYFHLMGLNPVQSGIFIQFGRKTVIKKKHGKEVPDGTALAQQFGIMLDGINGHLFLSTSLTLFPAFNNPNFAYSSNFSNDLANQTMGFSGSYFLTITVTPIGKTPVVHQIPVAKTTTVSQFASLIDQIAWSAGSTIEINSGTIPKQEFNLFSVWSDGAEIPVCYSAAPISQNKAAMAVILSANLNGLASLPVGNNKNYNINAQVYHSRWNTTSHYAGTTSDGSLDANNFAFNWFNPNYLMWKVVRNLTAQLSTPYAKAVAIEKWVAENMHYTFTYCYGKDILGTFQHLEGVCGNYADLAATMCSMAGLVARTITGEAGPTPNFFTETYVIDHQWTQVWLPELGEWITMDPTWNWITPIGSVQSRVKWERSSFKTSFVIWPQGTNYFSYFVGHEYQALSLYGQRCGVQPGSAVNQYPISSGIGMAWLLKKAGQLTPLNTTNFADDQQQNTGAWFAD